LYAGRAPGLETGATVPIYRLPQHHLKRKSNMNRLTVYDPFAEAFPQFFRGYIQPARKNGQAVDIKIDVKETAADYVVQAEVPGVNKDDIQVEIDGNRVSISAEVKRESEQKDGDRVLRSERYYGSVARSFTLVSEVDEAKATAKYESGVLILTLPKKPTPAAKRLAIH
jgi:HSP20 family protein